MSQRPCRVRFRLTPVALAAALLTVVPIIPILPSLPMIPNAVGATAPQSPPVITVSPAALEVELAPFASTTRSVTIGNSGGSDLAWSLALTTSGARRLYTFAPAPAAPEIPRELAGTGWSSSEPAALSVELHDLHGLRVLWDRSHGQPPPDFAGILVADLRQRGATVTEHEGPLTAAVLAGADVVWLQEMASAWTGAELAALATWVQRGGGLLLEGRDLSGGFAALLEALGVGIAYGGAELSPLLYIRPGHAMTDGVAVLLTGLAQAGLARVALPAGILAQDGAATPAVAYSGAGGGRVLVSGAQLFGDARTTFPHNRRFAHNVVDWLAGANWLQAQPREGTVPPGATAEVTFTFASGGWCASGLTAQAVVASSDPATPAVVIPARLDVTPWPRLQAATDALVFDAVYVGNVVTADVVVVNSGCADLNVSDVTTGGGAFALASPAAFTLAPDAQANLTVVFAPVRAGGATGQLRLLSDDPLQPVTVVELRGAVVAPPAIDATPTSLAVELPAGGRTTRTVDVVNRGKNDLVWSARVTAAAASGPVAATVADPPLRGVRILWDRAHGQADLAAFGVLAAELAARGAELTSGSDPWTPELLAGFDVVWSSNPNLEWSASEAAAAATWLRAGGSLLLTCRSSAVACNSLLQPVGTGISLAPASLTSGVMTDFGDHETTAGIGALQVSGAYSMLDTAGSPVVPLVRSPAGRTLAACRELEGGRLVAVCGEPFLDAPLAQQDNRRFGHQVFTWLGGYGWLQVDPRAGTVPAGATTTLKLTMAPQGRCGGLAPARLVLGSNDPATPEIAVVTELTVAGAPESFVSTGSLHLGAHFLGVAAADSFTIGNPGCVDLQVSPAVDDDQFTIRPAAPFTVPPHGRRTVVVTYLPTWPRPVLAALTLTTNDPEHPVVDIALRGLGIDPPVLAVAPDALTAALAPGGTATRTLTITNVGRDDLRWQIGTMPVPVAGASRALPQPRILLLETAGNGAVRATLARLGLPYTRASNWNAFNTHLRATPGWDLVAVEADADTDGGGNWGTALDALADYVEAGGRLLFGDRYATYYPDHRLARLLGVRVAPRPGQWLAVEPVVPEPPLFRVPNEVGPVRATATPPYDAGVFVSLLPGATALATFAGDAREPAIVRGPGGRTLFHAFAPRYCGTDDDGDRVLDMLELIENELFALGVGAPWLTVEPAAGLVPPGGSADVAVTWDATGLCGATYDAGLYLVCNDPQRDLMRVPMSLAVSEAPRPVARPAALAVGDCQVGAVRSGTVAIVNLGCAPLTVTDVGLTPGPFTMAGGPPFIVAAGDSQLVVVSFAPVTSGPATATLTVTTDDPARPTLSVSVSGTGVQPPVFVVATDTLAVELPPGGTASASLAIANQGLTDLHWTAAVEPRFPARILARSPVFGEATTEPVSTASKNPVDEGAAAAAPAAPTPTGDTYTSSPTPAAADPGSAAVAPDLADVLARLDWRGPAVTALIPDRFDFVEGVSGTYIVDGGQDMFDGGNALYTDRGGPLPYSDGRIIGHAAFGDRGRYVTRKLPGLFVLAADLGGIATFGTNGNLGADGAGQVDGVVLEMTLADGRRYLGLAKRVWGAGDPSVNHLVIVEAEAGITQSFPPVTDSDAHQVAGLASRTRLYYLLFGAAEGRLVDDQALARIMETFLGVVAEGTRWLDVSPVAGTLAPGGGTDLAVTFTAGTLPPGDHHAVVVLQGNDPLAQRVEVPARLRVAAGLALPASVAAPAGDGRPRNDPNPFNPRTELRFALAGPGEVEVLIHDARGLLVRRLSPGRLPAGPASVVWDGRTTGGQEAGSGVYLYRVLQDGRPSGTVGKMTLVR